MFTNVYSTTNNTSSSGAEPLKKRIQLPPLPGVASSSSPKSKRRFGSTMLEIQSKFDAIMSESDDILSRTEITASTKKAREETKKARQAKQGRRASLASTKNKERRLIKLEASREKKRKER